MSVESIEVMAEEDFADTGPTARHGRDINTSRVLPSPAMAIEAGLLGALCLVGLLGFRTTFDSWTFLIVSAIGVVLGVVAAHLVRALNWNWAIGVMAAGALYLVAGGPIAVRQDLIARVLPSWATEQQVANLAISGWKQLLTTLPPVAGEGSFVALPFLLALVFASASYGLARTYQTVGAPLIPVALLFGLCIALGAHTPDLVFVRALAWVALAMAWGSYRGSQQARLGLGSAARPRLHPSRAMSGLAVAVAAALVAGVAGPQLPGLASTRLVLRDYVTSPIDVSQYPSPMPSLIKFSSEALKDRYFFNKPLMTIEGASPGALVRFAVLDSYDGLVWGAGNGSFWKVGASIPAEVDGQPVPGDPVELTVTIDQAYASQTPLNIWVPSLGYATGIEFSGTGARGHADALAYDMGKGQGLALDQFKAGDVVKITTVPVPVVGDAALTPAGTILVSDERSRFVAPSIPKLTGGNVPRWQQLTNMAQTFRNGGWTDGTTRPGEEQYQVGDGQNRLKAFLASLPNVVGSDEQYAAMFALVANRIGFPARVVFGALMPKDGNVIVGKDVAIWVELRTTGGWVAVPPSFFIPNRDQPPETTLSPPQPPPEQVPDIAPANPKVPPDSINNIDTQANTTPPPVSRDDSDASTWWWPAIIISSSVVVGLLLLVALLLGWKAVRSALRRRTGSHPRQIAGGWADVMDRLRDMGLKVPKGLTWEEQASALGLPPLVHLAGSTNRAMFQPTPPDQAIVDAYWAEVRATKDAILGGRKGLARLGVLLTPRSLLPRLRRG